MMNWRDVFAYNRATGNLLWKHTGKRAGSLHHTGYIKVQYKKKAYQAHRIIWEMYNSAIPEDMEIDHINRVRTDNRLSNLRLVNRNQNQWNREARGTARSGSKWMARIRKHGELHYIGTYDTEELAHQAYLLAKETYHATC